jgi:hypothetical protein
VAASIAVEPKKTVGQNSTIQIGAYFAFDEASDRRAILGCIGKECLETLLDNFIEQCSLGLVAFVFDRVASRRGRGLEESLLNIGVGSCSVSNAAAPVLPRAAPAGSARDELGRADP